MVKGKNAMQAIKTEIRAAVIFVICVLIVIWVIGYLNDSAIEGTYSGVAEMGGTTTLSLNDGVVVMNMYGIPMSGTYRRKGNAIELWIWGQSTTGRIRSGGIEFADVTYKKD